MLPLLLAAGARVNGTHYYTSPLKYILTHRNAAKHTTAEHAYDRSARMLLDRGARWKKDILRGMIPDWVRTFTAARKRCRKAVLLVIGLRCFRAAAAAQQQQQISLLNMDKNLVQLVAKHMWATRGDENWESK